MQGVAVALAVRALTAGPTLVGWLGRNECYETTVRIPSLAEIPEVGLPSIAEIWAELRV